MALANGFGGSSPPEESEFYKYVVTDYALNASKLGLDNSANPALGLMLQQNLIEKASKVYYYKRYVSFMLIIHEVLDYDLWKKVFDNASQLRKDAGEISYQVLNLIKTQIRLYIF